MKTFEYWYPWTSNFEWMLPDGEEMMQNQFSILDEQIDTVLDALQWNKDGNQRTCIQAGGAMGMYPLRLSYHFLKTYTFEPLIANLECLHANLSQDKLGNEIVIAPCPLWSEPGVKMKMTYSKDVKNSYGAHHVAKKHHAKVADEEVSTATIDEYALEEVDLIWLDIEGAEYYALKGACWTVSHNRPVVVVENRWLPQMRQFGVKQGDAVRWLCSAWGYKPWGTTHGDTILVPER